MPLVGMAVTFLYTKKHGKLGTCRAFTFSVPWRLDHLLSRGCSSWEQRFVMNRAFITSSSKGGSLRRVFVPFADRCGICFQVFRVNNWSALCEKSQTPQKAKPLAESGREEVEGVALHFVKTTITLRTEVTGFPSNETRFCGRTPVPHFVHLHADCGHDCLQSSVCGFVVLARARTIPLFKKPQRRPVITAW